MKKHNLHNIKSAGFKIPDGYLESLNEQILSKLKNEDTLDTFKETAFKTPDGYFDSLEERILNKASDKRESKVVSLFNRRNIIYISGIAATILLLLNLFIFNNSPTFDTLETETVENYVISESIDSYEIASLLTNEQLNEDSFVEYNFEEEIVEEYLLNNIDIEDLMLEQIN
ncbi:hypothetical protein [uncultured Algibacter sp.]|uniref:hypothetical protein n=1 Tax=uncultured Algibacter sp. TaxID=298659 RepID=UPI00261CA923|nr:hypothetical protein [uncultured Algibacter sp.]